MERELLVGVLGGLIVLVIAKALSAFQRKSIKADIEFLEFEKKHLEEMKRSSIEMNRSSFRAIFALLFLIGVANIIPLFFAFVEPPVSKDASYLLTAIVWAVFAGLCLRFFRRYDNLKNFTEAMRGMDERLEKLRGKLGSNG